MNDYINHHIKNTLMKKSKNNNISETLCTDIIYEYFEVKDAKYIEICILKKIKPKIIAKTDTQAHILNIINTYLTNFHFTNDCKKIAAICYLELIRTDAISHHIYILSNIYPINIVNENIRIKITEIQSQVIRYLFQAKQFYTLYKVIQNLYAKESDEEFGNICCLIGHVYTFLNQQKKAEYFFLKALNSKECYSKASYYLGLLTKNKQYFVKGSQYTQQDVWSLLCKISCNKKPLIVSYKDLVHGLKPDNSNDIYFLNKIIKLIKQGNSEKQILDCIYSLKKNTCINMSELLGQVIQLLFQKHYISCSFSLGMRIYRLTGYIIKECFPRYLPAVKLIEKRKVSYKEVYIALSLIGIESRFYTSKEKLDNGVAVGPMQINKSQIAKINKALKKQCDLYTITHDIETNIEFGLSHYKDLYNQYCNRNLILTVAYYNGGHKYRTYFHKFMYLDWNNPENVMLLINMIKSTEVRAYIYTFIEHMIIFWYIYENIPLSSSFFCEDFLS